MFKVAVIAPCFRLRLPSGGPGFESQAHHLYFLIVSICFAYLSFDCNLNFGS